MADTCDSQINRFGWLDIGYLNESLFCTITDYCNGLEVIGKLTSISHGVDSDWSPEMAQDNIDDKVPFMAYLQTGAGAEITDATIIDAFKGRTAYTKQQSELVWKGTSPINVSLTLEFMALRNTALEVENAITALMKMVLPVIKPSIIAEFKDVISATISAISNGGTSGEDFSQLDNILGYIPNKVVVSCLTDKYSTEWYLASVNVSDSEIIRHKNGDMIRQSVDLELVSVSGLSKEDITWLTPSDINENEEYGLF